MLIPALMALAIIAAFTHSVMTAAYIASLLCGTDHKDLRCAKGAGTVSHASENIPMEGTTGIIENTEIRSHSGFQQLARGWT